MTITVVRASAMKATHPLARYALPVDFPFLVIEETMQIIEPVLHHLYKKHVTASRGRSRWVKNTADADSFDLRDWFDFLEHREFDGRIGKPWDVCSQHDYLEYREVLQDLISRQTRKYLEDATIRRRQLAVESFYKTAEAEGLYVGPFIEMTVTKGRYRPPVDHDPLAHIRHSSSNESEQPFGRGRGGRSALVKPLNQQEWSALKKELGPLPSEQGEQDPRSARSRTATETSITTGMRVDEIASLTTAQVSRLIAQLALMPEEKRPRAYLPLKLTKTKRLVEREVLVPAYIVNEMALYMDNERAESVKMGRAYAASTNRSYREPTTFFLNQPGTKRFAGRAVTTDTLEDDFHRGCIAAGLVYIETQYDPDDPTQEMQVKTSSHVYHDTRHTFAIMTYYSEVASGSKEPWAKVQRLLGHKSLSVTLNTYLKATQVHEETAGKEQWNNTTTQLRGNYRG